MSVSVSSMTSSCLIHFKIKMIQGDCLVHIGSIMVVSRNLPHKSVCTSPIYYYKSKKRDLKTRPTYECRCDERLNTKAEKSTRLAYTVSRMRGSTCCHRTRAFLCGGPVEL
jgi:hypothetical protein